MKIAVVYNRDSKNVINLFGMPNQEKIGLKTIKRLSDALKAGGHQVTAMEADKDLIDNLEHFMPRVVQGERPGMVFNVSYGLQGQARYSHVPSILEMIGIPYVASGPLGHSLALDKVVTKMMLRQNNIPTPDFVVIDTPTAEILTDLGYPMIVKPKNEAVSFGLAVVKNEAELREAAKVIFDRFRQPVLAEQYIDGREINVGILGNNPPEALPPVMLSFGKDGPHIYTYEDKTGRSGRTIEPICPAPIGARITQHAQQIAVRAFTVLGLSDCARVDMRLDSKNNLYVLEVNSLPSLGEHGSYLVGAAAVGLDFQKFVNRLVEIASARYFGTPQPPSADVKNADPSAHAFNYITSRRERMERRLQEWVDIPSRTNDSIGLYRAARHAGEIFQGLGLKPVEEFTDEPETYMWESSMGFENGTLFIAHIDVPVVVDMARHSFRRDPEWLFGDGVGRSRAPLVMIEYALRSLRSIRRLRKLPVGVLLYTDEGRDAAESGAIIRRAAARAKRVFVCRPGTVGDGIITQRRGHRQYDLVIEGEALRPGQVDRKIPVIRWAWGKLERIASLSVQKKRLSVATLDMKTERHPMFVPHRVHVTLVMTYFDPADADRTENAIRSILGKGGPKWYLNLLSDRPPMKDRVVNQRLAKALETIAGRWDIPLKRETSAWPSIAGLIPARTACVCGIGPVCRDRGTPNESVQRISLVQRTLLLSQFLAGQLD